MRCFHCAIAPALVPLPNAANALVPAPNRCRRYMPLPGLLLSPEFHSFHCSASKPSKPCKEARTQAPSKVHILKSLKACGLSWQPELFKRGHQQSCFPSLCESLQSWRASSASPMGINLPFRWPMGRRSSCLVPFNLAAFFKLARQAVHRFCFKVSLGPGTARRIH